MSDPVNQVLKFLGADPDGALSLRTSVADGGLSVQIVSRGVVVGGHYLVAANSAGVQDAG